MSPKEKAIRMADQYKGVLRYGQRQWGQNHIAKQCALIAVDEIINIDTLEEGMRKRWHLMYWNQVKKEIDKL